MNHKEGDILGNGRYRIVQPLGEGTYGVVWLAEDTQLQIQVAIKVLHPYTGGISDLQREAVTQARLNHQNIASIYSVNMDERFIAMEYVTGKSLDKYMKRHLEQEEWLTIDKCKHFLSQCCEALIYAHNKSVIHGDIKPGNVIVQDDDLVKLTDFGVAKVISSEEQRGYPLSSHRRLGSTTYMAPEVIKGEPRDFKSDIFSLGVLGYLLFTGHHPFYNIHPSGLFSVRDMLLSEEAARDAKEINPDIPDNYNGVIMKMISKEPENRYEHVKQAFEECVGIGLTCSRCNAKNPVDARYCMQCGESLEQVRDDQYKGRSASELVSSAFQLNSVYHYNEAISFCDEAIKLESEYSPAYHCKGFALSNLEKYDEALENFQLALKYARDESQKANIHTNMSYVYMMKGDRKKQIEELEKALECNPRHYKARDFLDKARKEE